MAVRLPDTAEPMGNFAGMMAKHIEFEDGDTLQSKLDTGGLGGDGSGYTQLSQAEYDALSDDEKMNGKEYRTYDKGHIYKLGIEYGKDASADDIVSFAKPSQLGLDDTSCTVVDLINAMFLEQRKDYSKRLIGIFPYVKNESNITDLPTDISSKGQVEICTSGWDMASAKFTDTANCVEYIGRTIVASGVVNSISWQEIATKDNLIVQTVSNSSSATDKVPSANIMARELFGNNITDATVNVLEFGAGQWKVDSNAKASSLQNMPVARAGKLYVIHLQGNDGLTPYTGTYKYAMYKYITIDGVEYIRSLNSDGTVGNIVNDTGWKQIVTKDYVDSVTGNTFNGKSVKTLMIDLSNASLQYTGTSDYGEVSLANYINNNINIIRVEGYYNPPSDSSYNNKYVVVAGKGSGTGIGYMSYLNSKWSFVAAKSKGGSLKGNGFIKVYYID